jgi:hypothetical protein
MNSEQRSGHSTLAKLLALCVGAGACCVVTAGASALMIAATDISAQARGGGHGGGGHGGGGHAGVGHGGGGHGGGYAFHEDQGSSNFAGAGRVYFWHGHRWRYGVGYCWRRTPAEYIWIC